MVSIMALKIYWLQFNMANHSPFNAAAQAIRPVVDNRMMIIYTIHNNIKALCSVLENNPAQEEVHNALCSLEAAMEKADFEITYISECFDTVEEVERNQFLRRGLRQYSIPVGVQHVVQHSNYVLTLLAQFLHIDAVNEAINPDNIPLAPEQLQRIVQELNTFATICDNAYFEEVEEKPADNYLPW
jgi:acid stress-induced BolA-like protein IbaG/YrbA